MHGQSDDDDADRSVEGLDRRIDELGTHVSRYDMYVMQLLRVLTEEPVLRDFAQQWKPKARTDVITRLMEARGIGADFKKEFGAIDAEMQPLLERQREYVRDAAGGTADSAPFENGSVSVPSPPSREELAVRVSAIERDISTTVKLYLMLGTLTTRLRGGQTPSRATRASRALH